MTPNTNATTTATSANTCPTCDQPQRVVSVLVCVGCDELFHTERKDSIACSQACRVWLRRYPERVQQIRRGASCLGVSILSILELLAIERLLPGLMGAIAAGTQSHEGLGSKIWDAYLAIPEWPKQ